MYVTHLNNSFLGCLFLVKFKRFILNKLLIINKVEKSCAAVYFCDTFFQHALMNNNNKKKCF